MSSWDSLENAFRSLREAKPSYQDNYLGFYSSWLNGYFREPWGMLMPMDDHGFHRGDGIFEAVRIQNGAYFDLQSHLARLARSAELVGMKLPKSVKEIEAICVELARRCGSKDGLLRLFVTRGPGGFSPSPAEVVGHQIYAIINKLKVPDPKIIESGVRAMICTVAAKDPWWSQIKSCNYLQNVLMKQEVLAKGYDFGISVDSLGRLCEGSTENMMLINQDMELLVPRFDYTLRGTSVMVVMKIAEELKEKLNLKAVRFADVKLADLKAAREAAFVGTTLAVLPIQSIDGHPIGGGRPGPVGKALNLELIRRMNEDPTLRTPF